MWETQAGFIPVQTTLDPCVYKIGKVPEWEGSYLASDPGVGDGEEIAGLMSTHVDDILLVADDATREMVGQALDVRSDSLERRSPFTRCGLFVSEDEGSLQINQSC